MREKTANTPGIVRDWTACFLACGFYLEEESDTSASAQVRGKKLVFRSNKRLHRNNVTSRNTKKQNLRKDSIPGIAKGQDTSPTKVEPNFADEDFIVFRLTKDGSMHAANNDDGYKTQVSAHGYGVTKSSKRNIQSKNVIEEQTENNYRYTLSRALNEDEGNSLTTYEGNSNSCSEKEKTKWSTESGTISKEDSNHIENGDESCQTVKAEKSESAQSDGSSSSFAFPELNWEEIGSPKQMQSPHTMHQLKHESYMVFSHSCRF